MWYNGILFKSFRKHRILLAIFIFRRTRNCDRLRQCSIVWHEISSSNTSKPVFDLEPLFLGDIHAGIVDSHAGYYVIIYCTSCRKLYGKTVENTAFDGFGWNFSRTVQARIIQFYTPIEDKRPQTPAGNGVTRHVPSGRLRNAIKYYRKVRKAGQKCRKQGLQLESGARYGKR